MDLPGRPAQDEVGVGMVVGRPVYLAGGNLRVFADEGREVRFKYVSPKWIKFEPFNIKVCLQLSNLA